MFSKNGKKTAFLHMAFSKEDPVQAEIKITKQMAQTRSDFTAGIIAGIPASQDQLEKFTQITIELEEEA